MAKALDYRMRARPSDARDDEATIRGRKIRFAPTMGYDRVSVLAVGSDGTVLLYRSSYGNYTTSRQSIVHGRAETPVTMYGHSARLSEYRDARNFAGSYYEYEIQNTSDMTPPSEESVAFVREAGRARLVGRGTVTGWIPGGAVATKVQIDEHGNPAGYDSITEEHSRVLDGGQTYDLGRLRFIGQSENGAFMFSDPVTQEGQAVGVYLWQGRRLRAWAHLPEGWSIVGTDGANTLLVRNAFRVGGDLAIVRGRSLHPLRFARPADWNDLGWDEVRSFTPGGAFRIDAFRGTSATPFELTLTPR